MKYSAFITGAGSGIGRHLALALAQKDSLPIIGLTLADLDKNGLDETKRLIESVSRGIAIDCIALDVTDERAQQAAMSAHVKQFGGHSKIIWILNAGIGEAGDLFDPNNTKWPLTYEVDYASVVSGLRSLVLASGEHQSLSVTGPSSRGIVMVVASASAVFPLPAAPVYSSAKAGAMMLVRSTAERLASRYGIKIVALCPEFVETPLVTNVIKEGRGEMLFGRAPSNVTLLKAEEIAAISLDQLILDINPHTREENKAGTVLIVTQKGKTKTFPDNSASQEGKTFSKRRPSALNAAELSHYAEWAQRDWPSTYQKIQVHKLSSDFKEATRLVKVPLLPLSSSLPPGCLLIKRVGVGVNASDVNRTSGRYHGSLKRAEAEIPFDCGFETVGVIAAVADDVKASFRVGQAVASMTYDGFATYALLEAKLALPIPRPSLSFLALLTSGLTASIALSPTILGSNRLGPGKTVLVTAAAGGTGSFAVQLAKLAGCRVVATCGGPNKARMVKDLGADRVVDYKNEKLKEVLKAEYPQGVDVVYESIGGEMFSTCLDGLADRGTLIVIGMMSEYSSGWAPSTFSGLTEKLLWKSASCIGFFLLKYAHLFRLHLTALISLLEEGKIVSALDKKIFVGIQSVPSAVEHLQSGQSSGKVVVQLAEQPPLPLGQLSRM